MAISSPIHQDNWDAIVVGAGLGGLASAAYLAAAGKRTLLLERYAVLGGSSHVFRRKKQWEFDCGVHYVGECGPGGAISVLMRGLGLDDRIEWLPLERTGFDTIVGPDLELRVPFGWDNYLESLIRTFPGEERGLRYYVSVLRRLAESFDRSMTLTSTREMARYALRCGTAAPWLTMPHAALLAACRFKPRTVLALSVQDGALATLPDVMPVFVHANLLGDFVGTGAWYPRGGGQMLAAGFSEVVRSHGGEIRLQAHVERIVIEGGAVKGVRLAGGEELRAPAVVAAGDIKRLYSELIDAEHLPGSLARRSKGWKMAHPLINTFFGVEIDTSKMPNSNYFVIPNWDDATSLLSLKRQTSRLVTKASGRDPVTWAKDFARNQPVYIQCSTQRDPSNLRSAPPGHAAIEAQTIAPWAPALWGFAGYDVGRGAYRRDAQYQQVKEILTEGMLQRVERVYPGASAKVRWSELGSPASQERFVHTSGGAAMGLQSSLSQSGPFRPGSRTPIKGLFLAGASTAWGPGTVGSMLSGLHAASAVTGRNLQGEIRAGAVIADRSRLAAWGMGFDPLAASRAPGPRSHLREAWRSDEDDGADAGPDEFLRQAAAS